MNAVDTLDRRGLRILSEMDHGRDEFYPRITPATVRREREAAIDPPGWVDCEMCNGCGVQCEDPYGFGKEWVCGECDGSGKGHSAAFDSEEE